MHILFAGGGTAGHINPALAVAGYIKEKHPDAKISYIGTADKLEAKLVPEKGYEFRTIEVAGFQRKPSLENIVKNISAVKKMFLSSRDLIKSSSVGFLLTSFSHPQLVKRYLTKSFSNNNSLLYLIE